MLWVESDAQLSAFHQTTDSPIVRDPIRRLTGPHLRVRPPVVRPPVRGIGPGPGTHRRAIQFLEQGARALGAIRRRLGQAPQDEPLEIGGHTRAQPLPTAGSGGVWRWCAQISTTVRR